MDASDGSNPRSSSTASCSYNIYHVSHDQSSSHTRSAKTHSRRRQLRSGHSEPLREWSSTVVGARYLTMLPASTMPDLPSPARAAIAFGRANFLGANRGHVRESNDTSIDSRLRHFAGWLDTVGFNQQSARRINNDLAIDLIGAYITEVKLGNSLPSTSKAPLGEQSLRNYILAAAQCLNLLMTEPCIIIDPKTANQKQIHLHPYLREIIAQRKAWSVPRLKGAIYN